LLINQCTDVMPHQMKGIGNGRQDVCLLILNTLEKYLKKKQWGGGKFSILVMFVKLFVAYSFACFLLMQREFRRFFWYKLFCFFLFDIVD
jgi:hypothetical protein